LDIVSGSHCQAGQNGKVGILYEYNQSISKSKSNSQKRQTRKKTV